jgi:GntR family transcriptional regulator
MKAAIHFQVFPSSGVPIYRQLMDQVHTLLSSGRLDPGVLLPSVRHVAEELQVNPMTVSKAYSLLERDGVLELVRGQGMRVKAPSQKNNIRERQAAVAPLLEQAIAKAFQLSLKKQHVEELLKPLLERLDHE